MYSAPSTTDFGKMKDRAVRKRKASSRLAKEEWNTEDLVKTEIDAAEALAAFSQQAHLPYAIGKHIAEGKWGCKQKRSARRVRRRCFGNAKVPLVKEESFSDSDKERAGSDVPPVAYNRFDTSEDSLEPVFRAESPSSPLPPLGTEGTSAYVKMEVQQSAFKPALVGFDEKPDFYFKVFKKRSGVSIKSESTTSGRNRLSCTSELAISNRPRGVGKTTLTDEEKELRKLRRIEANRESARQTIRRKQEACDRLTKTAGELNSSNETYKQELAKLKQECRALHEENSSLRQQLGLDNVQLPFNPALWKETKQESVANSMAMRMWLSARNAQLPPFCTPLLSSPKVESTCCSVVQVNMQDTLDSVESSSLFGPKSPRAHEEEEQQQNQQQQQQNQQQQNQQHQHQQDAISSSQSLHRTVSSSSGFSRTGYVKGLTQAQQRQLHQQNQHQLYQQQQHQQLAYQHHYHHSYYAGRKDAISAAALAAQARRKRKELTRMKSLRQAHV